MPNRRRFRRQLAAQANRLVPKLVVTGITSVIAGELRDNFCRSPYPNYALCESANSIFEEQAKEFRESLLSLGACLALIILLN